MDSALPSSPEIQAEGSSLSASTGAQGDVQV